MLKPIYITFFVFALSIGLFDAKIKKDQIDLTMLQEFISSLSEDQIPQSLKDNIKARDDAGDNSHYCCKIYVPPIAVDQTRLQGYNVIASNQYKCGYSSCGFLGWSSCTRWCTQYWLETRYYVDTYTIYQEQPCPQDQLVCCTDYLYVLGHCLHLSEIAGNLSLLQLLQAEGIVIPGITGGK